MNPPPRSGFVLFRSFISDATRERAGKSPCDAGYLVRCGWLRTVSRSVTEAVAVRDAAGSAELSRPGDKHVGQSVALCSLLALPIQETLLKMRSENTYFYCVVLQGEVWTK